ncbi:MAG TPA: amino acid permease, partial [Blastocatellia bacterium]|nr:amino acid permease [Blastocatellia bacterium]
MTTLVRTLTFRDVTLFIIGSVIGSGIFLTPGPVMHDVDGKIGPAILVWLAGGVLSLLGALTYGEMSAMKPDSGGLYVYIRDCFGKFAAFMFGWTLFFVVAAGSNATLAVAFGKYMAEIVPLSNFGQKVAAIAMIAVITAVNVSGTRHSANLTNLATGLKVGGILLMSAVLLYLGHGFGQTKGAVWPAHLDSSVATGFGTGMIAVLWAYEGWQYCTYTAGETKDPQRNFPRSLLIGTLSLIAIYLIANFAYLAALGPEGVSRSISIAAISVKAIIGQKAATFVALVILISILSAANTTCLGAPRVFYAMAADGLFLKRFAAVHERYKTPAAAIVVGSVWAAFLAAMGSFVQLLTFVIFIGWIFYGLAAASIFVYRRRNPDTARPYRVPGYPITPLVFILSAAALVVKTLWTQPVSDSIKGLGVVAIG